MKRNIVPFVTILILLCVQNAFADLTKLSHNRVGGGVSPAVLPHHRTNGSVYGGS